MKYSVHPKYSNICRRLVANGMLPRSICGRSFISFIKPLLDAYVLRWEKSAGGQRLVVVNHTAFQRWLAHNFPDSRLDAGIVSSRIQAVAQFRDTKAIQSDLPEIVCVRSTRDGVLTREGVPVETTRATEENGVFAFALKEPSPFALCGLCALVENPAVFQLFEKLELPSMLAIWTAGIASNRFIDWLAQNVQHGLRVLHLPDYDPVGLSEFLRLHKRLGQSATLHLPANLPWLFRHYSNSTLLNDEKNQRLLMKLRRSQNPSVREVVALIEENSGGLEHEALFIED